MLYTPAPATPRHDSSIHNLMIPNSMMKATLALAPLALLGAAVTTTPALAQEDPGYAPPSKSPRLVIERITTAVPWPRGVRYVNGKLYGLARGMHRSAGGPTVTIQDQGGAIFEIDPNIYEVADPKKPVSDAVRNNGKLMAPPTSPPFHVWNRKLPQTVDTLTTRPYANLVYDPASQNFFICGFSGIDLPTGEGFRKNATDSVFRFDMRNKKWHIVEQHDPSVVPEGGLSKHVSSEYYPHHDMTRNPPPHGLVNGPCGTVVAGDYLYIGAKDNTSLAQYDLREIRRNPNAPPPPARYIFEGSAGRAYVDVRGHGRMELGGTAALAEHENWLYVSFRTTSQIIRFALAENGDVKRPYEVEYVAQFPRYDPIKKKGSANIYDMAFDAEGYCYVSPGYDGAVYRYKPDMKQLYDATKDKYEPFVDLTSTVGAKRSGNICFDDAGNLYICTGQDITPDDDMRGVIYRVRILE
jgi:hypothetical protein